MEMKAGRLSGKLLIGCFAMLLGAALVPTNSVRGQNIVFIMADDCTFRDIGCYGGQAHTPNIDRLATEGMKFNRCFQASAMCSPTRHNLYTGLYPVKSGAYPNHAKAYEHVKSIVHYLKPHGYRVALSGKRHISPKSVFPFEILKAKDNNPNLELIDGFLEQCKNEATPFCLFACSNEPHSPWDKGDASKYPPEKVELPAYLVDTPVVRETFSKYLAEITYFDGQVGEILSLLDQHELADDTFVMVVSEQGNSLPFAKWTCYDNGLQSAMIVRWPGKVKPGVETDAMVEYVDVTPTLIDVAGGEAVDGLDGTSFLPVLAGEATEHKTHVYGIMTTRGIIDGSDAFAIRSVRDKEFKLVMNLNFDDQFKNIIIESREFQSMVANAESGDATAKKLVHGYQNRPQLELFHCDRDPMEMNNLASDPKYKDVVANLEEKLRVWMADQGDEGVATELAAFEHQNDFQQKKRAAAANEK